MQSAPVPPLLKTPRHPDGMKDRTLTLIGGCHGAPGAQGLAWAWIGPPFWASPKG